MSSAAVSPSGARFHVTDVVAYLFQGQLRVGRCEFFVAIDDELNLACVHKWEKRSEHPSGLRWVYNVSQNPNLVRLAQLQLGLIHSYSNDKSFVTIIAP